MNIYQHLFCIVPIILGLVLAYKTEFGTDESHMAKAIVFWMTGVLSVIGTIFYLGYVSYTFFLFLGSM